MGWKRPILGMFVLAIGLGWFVPQAWAANEAELRARITTARELMAQLQTDEMVDVASLELEYARIDIDEANDQLTNRRPELAEVAVIRLENRLVLIQALIEQATVDDLADQRETATIEMTREADQAQVAYEASEARRQALRQQVAEILNQLEVGRE
ncbi:MAG: hypothetical protein JW797_17260 [Bradymonadales bacterium]|nr:hypothetical protein [Bradymonadales bacterium]